MSTLTLTLTLTGETWQEVYESLRATLNAFEVQTASSAQLPRPFPTQPPVALTSSTYVAAPITPQPPTAAPAVPAAVTAPTPPAQANTTPTPVTPAVNPVPTAAPTYTLDALARAGATLAQSGKMQDALALLAKYGVQTVNQLTPEQYGPFATDLRALGAQI